MGTHEVKVKELADYEYSFAGEPQYALTGEVDALYDVVTRLVGDREEAIDLVDDALDTD